MALYFIGNFNSDKSNFRIPLLKGDILDPVY
jgi:hypothetical protein